jgi:hypothetical protein
MERKRNIQPALAERRRNAAREAAPRPKIERRNRSRRAMSPANSIEAVRLVDLSSNGCCLGFAEAVDYRPGQFVRLGFGGEKEAVRAIVRWCEPARIGVEFTTGLTSARIDAILGESRSPLVGLL